MLIEKKTATGKSINMQTEIDLPFTVSDFNFIFYIDFNRKSSIMRWVYCMNKRFINTTGREFRDKIFGMCCFCIGITSNNERKDHY